MDIHSIAEFAKQYQVLAGFGFAGIGGSLMYALRALPRKAWNIFLEQFTMTLEVDQLSEAYVWLTIYMSRLESTQKMRSLQLITGNYRHKHAMQDTIAEPVPEGGEGENNNDDYIWFIIPGLGTHIIRNKKRFFTVSRTKDNKGSSGKEGESKPQIESIRLRTYGRSRKPFEDLIQNSIDALKAKQSDTTTRVYSYTNGYWKRNGTINNRSVSTIITQDNIAEKLVTDARDFVASKKWYVDRGVPSRRGYLLAGPPGTGKTSLASALASELKRPIYVLHLQAVDSDGKLIEAMGDVPPRSILLIEDIDTISTTNTRVDDNGTPIAKPLDISIHQSINLSTLLNVIDGIDASEGRILVMTTNHPEKLDAALKRPGRIDKELLLAKIDAETAGRMFTRFYPESSEVDLVAFKSAYKEPITPAALQGIFLNNAHDAQKAIAHFSI